MSVTSALRREKIREYVLHNRKVEVKDLGRYLNASDATIRRDLSVLLKERGFKRIRGGVSLDETSTELSVAQRGYFQADKKRSIGRKAAELVHDGEVIFLGSGSTVIEVAKSLAERRSLTVITNSLPIINILVDNPGIDLVVTGGALRRPELSFIGHIVETSLSELRADKVIIGIQGIHLDRGLTNEFLPEAILDRVLVHFAPRLIIVADSSKLGKIRASFVGGVEDVGILVTDSSIDKAIVSDLEKHGVHVTIADG